MRKHRQRGALKQYQQNIISYNSSSSFQRAILSWHIFARIARLINIAHRATARRAPSAPRAQRNITSSVASTA